MAGAHEPVLLLAPRHRASQVRTHRRKHLELSVARAAHEYWLVRYSFAPSVPLCKQNGLGNGCVDLLELTYVPDFGPFISSGGSLHWIEHIANYRRADHRGDGTRA